MAQKIVVNRCYGGFGLSDKARDRLLELWPEWSGYPWDLRDEQRADPRLVKVVEELGAEASDNGSELEVVSIPDDVEWTIEDYDGNEWVSEKHRMW